MWWICLGVGFIFLVIGVILLCFDKIEELAMVFAVIGVFSFLLAFIALPICYYQMFKGENITDAKIATIEQRNTEVMEQIQPVIDKYLQYENDTYTAARPGADSLIAYSVYPEIKGNEFLMKQINIILDNQKEVTKLKLDKVELMKYEFWTFKKVKEL